MQTTRYRGLIAELRRAVIIIGLCLLAGIIVGQPLAGLVVGNVAYFFLLFREAQEFYRWLEGKSSTLPEANQVLVDVAEAIHFIRVRHRKTKRRLQQQLSRVEKSTSALADGVVVIAEGDSLQWWNAAAGEMLKLEAGTDSGQAITNFVRDPTFLAYLDAKDYSRPFQLQLTAESTRVLQLQVTQYGGNERLIVLRDVTHVTQLEQMRKDFVANVSHELRTPLTVLKGYFETFEGISEMLPPNVAKGLGQMSMQVERMNETVEDLMLLSRLDESDTLKTTALVDLSALARRVMTAAQMLSAERHEFLDEIEDGHRVLGVETELYSALSNIAFNAVKYSPEGGAIRFRLRAKGDKLSFSVKDEGVGIEPKHIPRLTERFYRADSSRNRKIGGTGLGLAITKHVLLRHQAEMKILSWPGKGSTFRAIFPRLKDSIETVDQSSARTNVGASAED
ncbi:phosphate regulon sensor histidine kinase PhoR [Umboniibacter marinipuniceus]|uniref:histidine kinase n=1 Tax=Umboniibacter marinipuniceus TaxID=569599 RepID=A0A3M0AH08_9GAMM|nr:phosphate regulon sensor histidine kinase PhoR [Umboniibacter marinipuniceus]RMA82058.1 PAS/PAC sensor signal transduction histidine kinase [Umboniibacter marinipuniceus]